MPRRALAAAAVAAAALGGAAAFAAANGSGRTYTARRGDTIRIPALNQVCTVSQEAGAVDLVCARPKAPRHQVVFFRDRILVWKAGEPDTPAWSGAP